MNVVQTVRADIQVIVVIVAPLAHVEIRIMVVIIRKMIIKIIIMRGRGSDQSGTAKLMGGEKNHLWTRRDKTTAASLMGVYMYNINSYYTSRDMREVLRYLAHIARCIITNILYMYMP